MEDKGIPVYTKGGTKEENWRIIIQKKFEGWKQEYAPEIKGDLKNERSRYVLGKHYSE